MSAICEAYTNPEQAALTSMAGVPGLSSSRFASLAAVAGKVLSGVTVATMTKSISEFLMPAFSIAVSAASYDKSQVVSPSAAIWRLLMPVRVLIHSSLVSTIFDKSSLVSILAGSLYPVPIN